MSNILASHGGCAVCADPVSNPHSLGVRYEYGAERGVQARFTVASHHQGYNGILHGGIVSALLDGAMTHCILHRDISALTAQLDVRFHRPITLGEQVIVTAQCESERRSMYTMSAELRVCGELRASAKGKFLRCDLARL
ncbi:PaaI family thioesterase [Vibrio sp. V39_P1S14PM300]|uniref:PaaI family thioesterase n=1 Tax=Vibrio sp. V39_P1S14PM300 TaxID=1938690 RepID=UPI0013723C7A|nr:PaaI family thioesterase [Vibrio sp. V39_P1S14PM300]NAX23556.1 hotdog fold thioesterase [Vibrio sp. V39_P1S14PM300]